MADNFINDFKNFILESGENIYAIGEFRPETGAIMEEIQPSNGSNNIYSISKVFTVTAIGMLVDRGLLKTQERVGDILAEELPQDYDPHWDATTVDMLLRHRVGLPEGALDIDCMDASCFDADYLAEVTRLPWTCPPDTRRSYTDGSYYILSRIAAKRAGRPMQLFLWEHLFLPLGFQEVAWSCCPQGHAMGATGLYIRISDMVKLGAVYLQHGLWQGRRILSEAWVRQVLDRGYELAYLPGRAAYSKGGMRGQNLMVLPSQNRVVGWLGHRRKHTDALERFVLEYEVKP